MRLLRPAVGRYVDALGFAAEQVVGAEQAAAIEEAANRQVLWLSDQPAWPVLRSQLMLLAAAGRDPEGALAQGVSLGALDDAHDPAAVLSWRLESAGGRGPLSWLAGIPDRVREDPTWGSYLAARQDIVRDLAEQVRELAGSRPQPWLEGLAPPAGHRLTGQIAVWRAANVVPDTDLRPTGAEAVDAAAAAVGWQRHLELQLANETPEIRRLTAALHREIPQLRSDPHTPVLARKLAALVAEGVDVNDVVGRALAVRPLPDDHPAAALQSRIEHADRPVRPLWETITTPLRMPEDERHGPHQTPGHDRGISF